MLIKGIIGEDTVNYKKISMYIAFPYCTFKCDKENGTQLCQNYHLTKEEMINVSSDELVDYYFNNTISKSMVLAGLEPIDSFEDLMELISEFRKNTDDDIVIYTGYNKDEISEKIEKLKEYSNIVVKFGRFVPNQKPHYDDVLGVSLASDNQYAERIS